MSVPDNDDGRTGKRPFIRYSNVRWHASMRMDSDDSDSRACECRCRRSKKIAAMGEIATIPPTTPPVMAAEFKRLAPGGKSVALGEDVGVTDTLGGPRIKPGPLPGKVY